MRRKPLLLMLVLSLMIAMMPATVLAEEGRLVDEPTSEYEETSADYICAVQNHPQLTYDFGTRTDDFYENFVQEGDRIHVNHEGILEEDYIYSSARGAFVDTSGNEIDVWVDDASYDYDYVDLFICQESKDPAYDLRFSCYVSIDNISFIPPKAVAFEPSTITLNAKDIRDRETGGYSIWYRTNYHDDYYGFFKEGDALVITAQDGSSQRYTYSEASDCFEYWDDDDLYSFPSANVNWGPEQVKIGNNEAEVIYGGVAAKITVIVQDSPSVVPAPAYNAEAAAEAEFQGTPDSSVPAVKKAKVKSGKKSFSVSWKKASKKQLKKFDKVEVQYSTNKSFPRTETKAKEVKKSKKSLKVKGLAKKSTYYVRVRDIKYVNGVKHVGKWAKAKKVKIK